MAVSIQPAKVEDAVEMVRVGMIAFANDALSKSQRASPEQEAEYTNWRTELTKLRMTGSQKPYFKAVDESRDAIVGYMGLYGPHADITAQESFERQRPSTSDAKHDNELKTKVEEMNERWLGGRDDLWHVQSMLVHPDYQGRGIAKRLLQRGLEEVDKVGQDVYLEGTEAGQSLYLTNGFEVVETITLMNGQYSMKAMIRRHRGTETNNA